MPVEWTPERVEIVKSMFPISSYEEIAALIPGLSRTALQTKAQVLGVRKSAEYFETHKRVAWNKKERIKLTCQMCGAIFSAKSYQTTRKYCSVPCKRAAQDGIKLNANREDFWTPEEIEILKIHFPVSATEDLCKLLPRHTLPGIRTRANKLGIKKTKEYRLAYLKGNRQNAIEALKGSTPWNKSAPIEKHCPICDTAFTVYGNHKKQLCCSQACANMYKSTVIRGENHPLYQPPADRICQWCGKAFQCKPAKVRYGEGLYCSRNCLGSATCKAQMGRRSSLEIAVEHVLTTINEPFEVQKQVGPWLVDFYLPNRNLVVECDGKYWHGKDEVIKRDRRKNYWLHKNNYNLLRLGEDAIRSDVTGCVIDGLAKYGIDVSAIQQLSLWEAS